MDPSAEVAQRELQGSYNLREDKLLVEIDPHHRQKGRPHSLRRSIAGVN